MELLKRLVLLAGFLAICFGTYCEYITDSGTYGLNVPAEDFKQIFDSTTNNTYLFALCPAQVPTQSGNDNTLCPSNNESLVSVCEYKFEGYETTYLGPLGYASEVQYSLNNGVIEMMYATFDYRTNTTQKLVVALGCSADNMESPQIYHPDETLTVISINKTYGCISNTEIYMNSMMIEASSFSALHLVWTLLFLDFCIDCHY